MQYLILFLLVLFSFNAKALVVSIDTSLGVLEITLHPESAPNHVENFLNYVNDDDYSNSFFHRSVPGFIIQAGGFSYSDDQFTLVPTDPAVDNEFNLSNVRGTVAMAKLSENPNSATNQWFINLADNSTNLDNQNGGFTVFGTVSSGMSVADDIANLVRVNASGAFSDLPIRNFENVSDPIIWDNHLVMINETSISEIPLPAGIYLFLSGLVGFRIIKKSLNTF
jgi:peptidyl-prolyl cis-trans isomerase A (cyclophilin A)